MDETFDNGRIRHAEIVQDGLPPGLEPCALLS
jgi:hypothetical protein